MTRSGLATSFLVLAALAACASAPSQPTAFELGASEFRDGDELVIEDVRSSTGSFSAGSEVTIRGRYRLASRDAGVLYFGTTVQEGASAGPAQPKSAFDVVRGAGEFEFVHRVTTPGHLHLTFYDAVFGQPFGGQYFGKGESLLLAKTWAYAR